ncbi:hypothetical protein QL285_020497 [Trifolium repens]|nr:hypothetical protein QL285_020497 [Trifolium repens]
MEMDKTKVSCLWIKREIDKRKKENLSKLEKSSSELAGGTLVRFNEYADSNADSKTNTKTNTNTNPNTCIKP